MGDGSCQVLFETDEPAVAPVGDASARRSGGFERLGAGDAHRSARRSARFGTPSQQIAGLAGGSRHGVDFALLGHSLDIYFGSAVRFDRAPAYGQIGLDFGAAGGREGAAVALAGDLGMCAAGCADVERRGVYDGSAGDPTAAGGRQALQYLRFGYADADVAVADVVDFGIDRQQQDALFVDRRDDMADDLFVGFDDEFSESLSTIVAATPRATFSPV